MNISKGCPIVLITALILTYSSSYSQAKEINRSKQSDSTKKATNIFLNSIKFDTISFARLAELRTDLDKLNLQRGIITFSGIAFPRTVALGFSISPPKNGRTSVGFNQFLDRCKPGSRITLEKCVVINTDGTLLQSYNKSIYLK